MRRAETGVFAAVRNPIWLLFAVMFLTGGCSSAEKRFNALQEIPVRFDGGSLRIPSHYELFFRPANPLSISEYRGPSDFYIFNCRKWPRSAGRLFIGPRDDVLRTSRSDGVAVSQKTLNGITIKQLRFTSDEVVSIRGVLMSRGDSTVMVFAEHASEIADEIALSYQSDER